MLGNVELVGRADDVGEVLGEVVVVGRNDDDGYADGRESSQIGTSQYSNPSVV